MTDKQIIIDGEQCEYLRDTGLCRLTYCLTEKSYDCSMCKDNPNCYYKQLKRKEQECEELKKEIKKHNDDMFKNPPEKRFYCKGCTLPYISKKLKQTLTEIKEIIRNQGHIDILEEQILQKISEVEE